MSLTEDNLELADQRHKDGKVGGCDACDNTEADYGLEVSPGIWKYYCWPCYRQIEAAKAVLDMGIYVRFWRRRCRRPYWPRR